MAVRFTCRTVFFPPRRTLASFSFSEPKSHLSTAKKLDHSTVKSISSYSSSSGPRSNTPLLMETPVVMRGDGSSFWSKGSSIIPPIPCSFGAGWISTQDSNSQLFSSDPRDDGNGGESVVMTANEARASKTKWPPMMSQYLELKAAHPGYLLLFRMGDFYEMFFEDAARGASILGIALTTRGSRGSGANVPLAGIPAHALDSYLERLVRAGVLVAVCEQVEEMDPARPGILAREVHRLVTPGTLIEDRFLVPREHNYLAAITALSPSSSPSSSSARAGSSLSPDSAMGLAWLDMSTGAFHMATTSPSRLSADLARLSPSEVLVSASVSHDPLITPLMSQYHVTATPPVRGSTSAAGDPVQAPTSVPKPMPTRRRVNARRSKMMPAPPPAAPKPALLGSVLPGPPASFASGAELIAAVYPGKEHEALTAFSELETEAGADLLGYVWATQRGRLPHLSPPGRWEPSTAMSMDAATRRSLELTKNIADGSKSSTLLSSIDRTVTAAGGRLLAERLAAPLTNLERIQRRSDLIAAFVQHSSASLAVRSALRGTADAQRALQRLSLGKGNPRDAVAIGATLAAAAEARFALEGASKIGSVSGPSSVPTSVTSNGKRRRRATRVAPRKSSAATAGSAAAPGPVTKTVFLSAAGAIPGTSDLANMLEHALVNPPPSSASDGPIIAAGWDPELDEARQARDGAAATIEALAAVYRSFTGIATLKIKHNHLMGYHVEVPATADKKIPKGPIKTPALASGRVMTDVGFVDDEDDEFVSVQSLASTKRYRTTRLEALEAGASRATAVAGALESMAWERVVGEIVGSAVSVGATARALAMLDVASSLAEVARDSGWTRPVMTKGRDWDVVAGRHVVVEEAQRAVGLPFVPNDCRLGDGTGGASPSKGALAPAVWIVTGPNMGGKSTFLRQNALIAILAQIGSFVPADYAKIGVVDRLYSRVGAGDDLARDRSTFMVEMTEAASILRGASERSLVIMDEVGRGTATHDGLALAWAIVEHLYHDLKPRLLFATHYHELAGLKGRLDGVQFRTLSVAESGENVVFLRKIVEGVAGKSYGIQVARLAGLPDVVIEHARELLARLEQSKLMDALSGSPGTSRGGRSVRGVADDNLDKNDDEKDGDGASVQEVIGIEDGAGTQRAVVSATDVALRRMNLDQISPKEALDILWQLKAQAEAEQV